MTDDVVAKAEAALTEVTPGPWVQVGYGNIQAEPVGAVPRVAKAWNRANGAFIAAARELVPELVAEVKRLRSYRLLPDGYVWQDYYSPDDVIKIRAEYEAEIEQLRGLQRDDRATAQEAIAERDQLRAENNRYAAFVNAIITQSRKFGHSNVCPVCYCIWHECECGVGFTDHDIYSRNCCEMCVQAVEDMK